LNYQAAQFWMNVIVFCISAAVWVYAWRVKRDMATNEKITEIEASINDHVRENSIRLAHMDERLRQAIGHTELKPLYDRLNSVDKCLSQMEGKLHTLDLIHEMLLNEGGQKK